MNFETLENMAPQIDEDTGQLRLLSKSKKVLVIDDDEDMAEVIKHKIESYNNCKCDTVTNPYEALNHLSDSVYDLVLVDQNLPGLLGSIVLSKVDEYVDSDPLIIDSCRYNQRIPVVLMSGSKIRLTSDYYLRHFEILEVIQKKNILQCLSKVLENV